MKVKIGSILRSNTDSSYFFKVKVDSKDELEKIKKKIELEYEVK